MALLINHYSAIYNHYNDKYMHDISMPAENCTGLNSIGFVIDNPKLIEDLYAEWIKEPDDPKWTYTQYTEKWGHYS